MSASCFLQTFRSCQKCVFRNCTVCDLNLKASAQQTSNLSAGLILHDLKTGSIILTYPPLKVKLVGGWLTSLTLILTAFRILRAGLPLSVASTVILNALYTS